MNASIDRMVEAYERGWMTRRQLVARLGALCAVAGGAVRGTAAVETEGGSAAGFEATELNHIALRVTDVGRSRDFYVRHLGLEVSREGGSSAFLNCGNNFLALFRGDRAGLDHYCYSVRGYDAAEAEAKVRSAGMSDIRRAGNRLYFSDPDGLTVQVAAEQHLP